MATEEAKKKKSCCPKNKCKAKKKPKHENGKGDSPRNNQSNKFRNNYDNINWSDE